MELKSPPKVTSKTDNKALTITGCPKEKFKKQDVTDLKIKLRFLRHCIFFDSDKDIDNTIPVFAKQKGNEGNINSTSNMLDQVVVTHYKNAPRFENYDVRAGLLTVGYLYVIKVDNPSKYDEYFVDETGKLTLLKKQRKEDVRSKTKGGPIDHIEAKYGEKYWVNYSTIQWPAAFLKHVCGSEIKENFMTLVECLGEKYSYLERGVWFQDNQESYALIDEQQSIINGLYDKELVEEPITENYIREDMFIVLDDPINMSEIIAERIETELVNHLTNVTAIQNGEVPEQVLNRFTETCDADIHYHHLSDEQRNASDMFSLASISYQLVYSSREETKDLQGKDIGGMKMPSLTKELVNESLKNSILFGFSGLGVLKTSYDAFYNEYGLHEAKLRNILGVKERKKQRTYIRSLQDDLGNLLESNYFKSQCYVLSHTESSDLCNLIGKSRVSRYFVLLVKNPHQIDNAIDLKNDEEKDIKWQTFVDNILNTSKGDSISSNIDKELHYADIFSKTISYMQKDEDDAKAMGVLGVSHGLVHSFFTAILELSSIPNGYLATSNLKILNKVLPDGEEFFAYDLREVKVTRTLTDTNKRMISMLESPAFQRVTVGIKIINGILLIKSLSGKKNLSKKDIADITANASDIGEAVLNVRNSLKKQTMGKEFAKRSAGKIGLKAFGTISGGIGVYMSLSDMRTCYLKHDMDAAIAYSIAGIAGVIGLIWGVFSLGGPIGWIAATIATIATIAGAYLLDSALEAFFKSFVFSNEVSFKPHDGELTWQFNKRFYDNKKLTLGTSTDPYLHTHYKKSISKLLSIIVAPEVTDLSVNKIENGEDYSYITGIPDSRIIGDISSFTLKMAFKTFLHDADSYNTWIYYSESGKKSDGLKEHKGAFYYKTSLDFSGVPALNLTIDEMQLNYQNLSKSSFIVLTSRLVIGNTDSGTGQFFPVAYDSVDRFVGTKINLHYDPLLSQTPKSMVGTLEEITNEFFGA